ncbi:iron ABC transporter permease [Carboxylicivirga mesophila]|uniref:Iron ABC transporter permease n=2 Tax=Carboxylicivirga TaxID=1628153 RepID=A0A941F150_9BACT|nr:MULTISPECIES: iron ABC transporter permease [Carboxylicivirga]MBR8534866.1 iron ABC transporter permease [Carboxylicivirga sediminis]MBS2212402.1 iron ABC transporter permease [Carboxylicivirga mesophila]
MEEHRVKWVLGFGLLVALLLLLFMANIGFGSVSIPFDDILNVLLGEKASRSAYTSIILMSRLPQTITAVLAGAGLAVGGLQMQTLFRNPLAGPSILGISSGAGLGVALVVLFAGNILGVTISGYGLLGHMTVVGAAFLGAFTILLLIVFFAQALRDNTILLIVGIMIGYAASAIIGVMKFYSPKEDVHAYVIWGLGSFSNVSWEHLLILIPIVLIGLVMSLLLIKPLNVLLLGENYAENLGINIRNTRLAILFCTGILTAAITAFCGPIAFLGLAVPHLTKGLFRTSDQKVLMPAVILAGAVLALFCNLIARLPGFDGALPINVVTGLIGAPIVISVIIKRRKMNANG